VEAAKDLEDDMDVMALESDADLHLLRAEVHRLEEDNRELRERLAAAYREMEELRALVIETRGAQQTAVPGGAEKSPDRGSWSTA
jgi:hypothetical protein